MSFRTFFLGAGFSKALNPAYPTLAELSASVVASFLLRYPKGAIREHFDQLPKGFDQDIEQLLTYLSSDWPWKSSVDSDLDKALYKSFVYEIAAALKPIPMVPIPEDFRMFIHFMRSVDNNKIISLNYDSLIEEYRFKGGFSSHTWGLKGLDIQIEELFLVDRKTSIEKPWIVEGPKKETPADKKKNLLIAAREWINQVSIEEFRDTVAATSLQPQDAQDSLWVKISFESFHEVKDFYPIEKAGLGFEGNTGKVMHLHGSLHWLGDVTGPTIRLAGNEGHSSLEKLPAIVPPVMDKSHHYAVGRLKTVWNSAHAAIQQSKEIVVIGFSFPPTDVSCQFLFKSAVSPGTRVVVVNRDPSIKNRCDSIFGSIPEIELDYRFSEGDDALKRYIQKEVLKTS